MNVLSDSNMYWYLDYLNARRSLPAAQVLQVSALHKIYICSVLTSHELLQGRKHAKTKSVLPLFRCLGTKATAQVDRLLDAMFNVTISSFRKGGVHCKVLQQFALALIRHDAEVVSRCGVTNRRSVIAFDKLPAKLKLSTPGFLVCVQSL